MVRYRLVDNSLQSFGIGVILVAIGIPTLGVGAFLILCQILGVISEGVAMNLALIAKRIPDITNLVRYSLLLMFFASPVLYPLSFAKGLHYRANEFNPFSYFVEASRHVSELDSVFTQMDMKIIGAVLLIFVCLAVRGYSTLERQRWEISKWS